MSDRDDTIQLLRIALREYRALGGMLDAEVIADEIFGFVVQQAIEKGLKAWLCIVGRTYPFTHDLGVLLTRLDESGQDVEAYWNLVEYNPFAVELRYSSSESWDPLLDRIEAMNQVAQLLRKVESLVGESA